MVTPDNTNQANAEDDQIYEINIDKIYQDYIQNIDSKRSYVNVIGQKTSSLLTAIGGNLNAVTTNSLTPASSYQESRCHTFFRIIGFPVINSNQSKIYNPGHDIVNPGNLQDKIDIANDQDFGFLALSDQREQYFLNNLQIFNTPNTIDAGVLALSGGAIPDDKRLFAAPFKSQDPFDFKPPNQSYPGVYNSIVGSGATNDGGGGDVQLTDYQDVLGNKPASTTLPPTKYHIIKPFMVDPRIDFSCSPSTNRIAIPFVPNKTYLRVSSTAYADPPLLETIIMDRFNVTNQQTSTGDYTQQFAQFIKDISNNPDQSILGQIVQNDIQQLSTNRQFLQFVNIIQAMVKKLVEAQKIVNNAQCIYYWVPVPSTIGPEGGCTVQPVLVPTNISTDLVTSSDRAILSATAQSLFSQTQQNAQASAAQGQADVGGFAKSLKNSLGPSTSTAYVNNSMTTLDQLNGKRNSILSKAGGALQTIEIIMGEFSGLGLCDMIAILATLYTMPQQNLLGFLDSDALGRMNTLLSQNNQAVDISTAMTSFISTMNQFYQLMEAIYQSELTTQGLSV